MALPGVCHGAATEYVIALREIRQGGILPVEALASLHRGRIPPGAMTDCS